MSEWLVKKGNTAILEVEIKDEDGDLITNLNEVIEAIFQVKELKTSLTKKIEVTLGDGVEMNTPSSGWVEITLRPSHTDITAKRYFMGLQLKWSADEVFEADIEIDGAKTNRFYIKQDVVL